MLIASVAAACAGPDEPTTERRVDMLFAERVSPGEPGCAVGVSRGNTVLYTQGYGIANLDYDLPVTPETVFDVGSVTKQFTAASIVLLSLDGALTLDDDVRVHLPELPDYGQPITIRHLLHHTSGIRDYLNLMALGGRDFYAPISHQDIVELMARQSTLNSMPGDRYRYSNTGYMLLATIVDRVTGRTYGEFARERIFEPLGMTRSFLYENAERIVHGRATGYAPDGADGYRMVHNYPFATAGDGQLYTTVGDLLRWSHALMSDAVSGPELGEVMLSPGTLANGAALDYGTGLALGAYRGLTTNGHGGSTWGFRAQVVRIPDEALAVAVLCNREDLNPRGLAYGVADLYLEDRLGPAPEADPRRRPRSGTGPPTTSVSADPVTPVDLADYVGDFYSDELGVTYHLAVDGSALGVRIGRWPRLALELTGSDTVAGTSFPAWTGPRRVELIFTRDALATVTGFALSAGQARDIRFIRLRR
jgi:CubicO group peptidase (beta-lactamase class C family)